MSVLGVFDQVTGVLSGAWWTYPLILGIAGGDAILPILPGETAVVTGGVLSAGGGLSLPLVILVGALGAFIGDNITYLVGRRAGPWARKHVFSGRRAARTLSWAEKQLDRRGGTIIVVARFVPGGRTATTFVAGTTVYVYRKFALATMVGGTLWAAYNALLGRIGGAAFEDETWKALLVALAGSAVGMAAIESGRYLINQGRANKPDGRAE